MKSLNILILRLTAIGDVLHTIPSLYLLRKYFPNSYIAWAVCKYPASLLTNHQLLNKVYVFQNFPKSICQDYSIIKEMANTEWDIIIDYHFYLKTLLLRSFLKGKVYTFSYSDVLRLEEYLSYLFSNQNANCSQSTNVTSKYLMLTQKVILQNSNFTNISLPTNKFNIFCNNSQPVVDFMTKNNIIKYIVLCPNSSEKVRIWKLKYWMDLIIHLINKKKYKILLLGLDFTPIGNQIKNKIIQGNLDKSDFLYILPK